MSLGYDATRRRRVAAVTVALTLACLATDARPYPLDGYPDTGIARLEAYRLAVKAKNPIVPPGAQYPTAAVTLRLADRADFVVPAPDPELGAGIRELLGDDARFYGLAVLDLADPSRPAFAEHNADMVLNPGSVGKIIVALGVFQALADVYPSDIAARERVLKDTEVTADAFIRHDSHKVPWWRPGDPKLKARPLVEGDTANLYSFLDWMLSASSNAAASMVQKEMLLLRHFGTGYPASAAEVDAYLTTTPKGRLSADLAAVIQDPVTRNGLSLGSLRQGSFFTREGKSRVPGTSSYATSRELLRYLVLLEQGRLVDAWSSLAIKRLLYLTDRRIRYASSPALDDAAVYYKSGSLYGCKPEPGFACAKYQGNVKNYMNSVAIIETPDRKVPLHYMVVVMSNVLRKNSAVAHQTLATRIHRLMEARHPIPEERAPSGNGGS